MNPAMKAESALFSAALNLPPALQKRLVGKPIVVDGQRLDTETQLVIRLLDVARTAPETMPIPKGRKELNHRTIVGGGEQVIGSVRDVDLDGIAGRLYVPRALASTTSSPLLVFFHGGAWIFGDLDSHDASCRFVAEQAGIRVLAVDYRLAPEHPFPAAYEDCVAAYRWVLDHADQVGADTDRLAVGGDSAGGNLASVVAIEAARQGWPLALQWLIYPAVDFSNRTASRKRFGEGFVLTEAFMTLGQDEYLGDADVRDPRASPLLAELPERLAPAYVCTAGFDPLRDEGEAYAEKLAAAGVEVELRRFSALIHGFFNLCGVGKANPAAVRETCLPLANLR